MPSQVKELTDAPGRGRSYGELDILFMNKVPAWRFKSTKVDRKSPHHPAESKLIPAEFAALREDEQLELENADKPAVETEINHLETRK